MHVIDRRQNPKSKSLGNRQRFMRRVKSHMRRAVKAAIADRRIADLESGQKVSIRSSDISEPSFQHQSGTGNRDHVLPGNRGYQKGDRIRKPSGGSGRSGRGGSSDGDGEDTFAFVLTREEFLDLFFEDLALPNLAKMKLKSMVMPIRTRAGFAADGSPQRLNKQQTMRRSLARRIALRRPKLDDIAALQEQLERARQSDDEEQVQKLTAELNRLRRRMQIVPFLDTVDLRYNHFQPAPRPTTQAVMFCLMDTSASMTEDLKDLAKRFYMLLHLFLTRHYQAVELVFIRHTYTAAEVDEETFFHGRETGGTVVSSALEEMQRVVEQRYPVADWNIYAAQASDGHNFDHDMPRTLQLLEETILPLCQYYAYIEVNDHPNMGESLLWEAYLPLASRLSKFEAVQVFEPSDIYPVFHQLFARSKRVNA